MRLSSHAANQTFELFKPRKNKNTRDDYEPSYFEQAVIELATPPELKTYNTNGDMSGKLIDIIGNHQDKMYLESIRLRKNAKYYHENKIELIDEPEKKKET